MKNVWLLTSCWLHCTRTLQSWSSTSAHTHLSHVVGGTCECPWGSPGFRPACVGPSQWACWRSGCSWTASPSSTACPYARSGQRGEAAGCQSKPAENSRISLLATLNTGLVLIQRENNKFMRIKVTAEYHKNTPYLSVRTIKVAKFNSLHAGVGPVQAFGLVVNGEPIGPRQIRWDDDNATGGVHSRTLDLWVGTPVGPVHETTNKRND